MKVLGINPEFPPSTHEHRIAERKAPECSAGSQPQRRRVFRNKIFEFVLDGRCIDVNFSFGRRQKFDSSILKRSVDLGRLYISSLNSVTTSFFLRTIVNIWQVNEGDMNQFGECIKKLREQHGLLQRQVATQLGTDTPMLSKIERGERKAKRVQVTLISKLFEVSEEDLLSLWLADKVYEVVKNETVGLKALIVAEEAFKKSIRAGNKREY